MGISQGMECHDGTSTTAQPQAKCFIQLKVQIAIVPVRHAPLTQIKL